MITATLTGLGLWNIFAPSPLPVDIPMSANVVAGLATLVAIIFYFIVPKNKLFIVPLGLYLLTLTSVMLVAILTTDTATISLALCLIAILLLFSRIFGGVGLIVAAIIIGTLTTEAYMSGNLAGDTIIVLIVCGVLPILISYILWKDTSALGGQTSDDNDFKDVTSKLREVADKSEIIINAIGDGIMTIDAQGTIQLINPAAQEILGWGKQDALALNYKSVLKLIDIKGQPVHPSVDPVEQALNTNQEIRNSDITLSTKNDKKLFVSLVASPIGEAGSGVIIVFRDVTKEKAEEKEQAEFISTASHEMRTPVASIEGYLGLALNPTIAQIDPKARELIAKAQEAAQHLGRLFQDLLDISKTDDNRLVRDLKIMDVVPFARDVTQGLLQKAGEKGLRLTYKPLPEGSSTKQIVPVYYINQDPDHVREVLNNLIENAIKYTPKGDITVDITGDDQRVIVSVADTGLGIPAEDIPHLFQKFYRVENQETNAIGGTGLGLYLSRRLVESMGGRLWVESVYKQGSTFLFEIPRISTEEARLISSNQALQAQQASLQQSIPQQPTQQVPASPQQPEYSVPRGEVLSAEQKAAYVAKLREQASGAENPEASTSQPEGPTGT